MSRELFEEGGPHKIRKTGLDQYTLSIPLPEDEFGMTGRECPSEECSPGAFKVRFGTGLHEPQQEAYCPYCRHAADPDDFTTDEQLRFAKDIALAEASKGVNRMMANAFGLGVNGKRKMGGGLISIELSMKSEPIPPIRRPLEEQLRRDIVCPQCTLAHAVYGLAVWCPDCGVDVFLTHVETEAGVLKTMLGDVERRGELLGSRVAARDIENGLEDTVSLMEGALKALSRRKLQADGASQAEIESTLGKTVRSRYQSYDGAAEVLRELFHLDVVPALEQAAANRLRRTLEKRHPITHNLGIVDKKYLQRVLSGETEGRDVDLGETEVLQALDDVTTLIHFVHSEFFRAQPDATTDRPQLGSPE